MPFKRYVEIGRVALVNFGEDYGKLVVISDVVDQNRVSCASLLRLSQARAQSPSVWHRTRRLLPASAMQLPDRCCGPPMGGFLLGWAGPWAGDSSSTCLSHAGVETPVRGSGQEIETLQNSYADQLATYEAATLTAGVLARQNCISNNSSGWMSNTSSSTAGLCGRITAGKQLSISWALLLYGSSRKRQQQQAKARAASHYWQGRLGQASTGGMSSAKIRVAETRKQHSNSRQSAVG